MNINHRNTWRFARPVKSGTPATGSRTNPPDLIQSPTRTMRPRRCRVYHGLLPGRKFTGRVVRKSIPLSMGSGGMNTSAPAPLLRVAWTSRPWSSRVETHPQRVAARVGTPATAAIVSRYHLHERDLRRPRQAGVGGLGEPRQVGAGCQCFSGNDFSAQVAALRARFE